jgi:hypothetical protein
MLHAREKGERGGNQVCRHEILSCSVQAETGRCIAQETQKKERQAGGRKRAGRRRVMRRRVRRRRVRRRRVRRREQGGEEL